MTVNGKVLVLGSVLKVDRPFKAATITLMTGLSRQLVFNHLNNLTETGYLEKVDKHYIIRDREGLLSTLMDASDTVESGQPKPGGFFDKDFIATATTKIEFLVASRSLDLPMSLDARIGYLKQIDDSITVLKQMRKYLSSSTKTKGSARKFWKKQGGDTPEGIEQVWRMLSSHAGENATVDLIEFEEALKEAMVEEE